ncbi:MAG: hypothetical protein AUH86_08735 [Acidobacteria bacterium 13_1_40CM_4_58_4]|nr:MAG: hypothetical protein AUH86_08735 [Acidobacteria bacterium 13_1_40CM_4_58_4]
MSEEGDLLNVSFQEFFIDPPPQKQDFLGFWLATGFTFPEGNYCVRTNVMKEHFPDTRSEAYFQDHAALGFIYRFMTQGYCPFLIPNVANFGREHWDQRSRRLRDIEGPAVAMYYRRVKDYKSKLLKGELTHYFRAGDSEVIGKMRPQDLWRLRRQIWRHTLLRSRLLRRDPYTLALRIGQRFLERFGY